MLENYHLELHIKLKPLRSIMQQNIKSLLSMVTKIILKLSVTHKIVLIGEFTKIKMLMMSITLDYMREQMVAYHPTLYHHTYITKLYQPLKFNSL